jgi:hypothetical protein
MPPATSRTPRPTMKVTIAAMSCQHAIALGRHAGNNVAAALLGTVPATAYRQPKYVTCLDLGEWGAVYTEGWDRQLKLVKEEAKTLKHNINSIWIYPPIAERAAALAAADPLNPGRLRQTADDRRRNTVACFGPCFTAWTAHPSSQAKLDLGSKSPAECRRRRTDAFFSSRSLAGMKQGYVAVSHNSHPLLDFRAGPIPSIEGMAQRHEHSEAPTKQSQARPDFNQPSSLAGLNPSAYR